MVVDIKMCRFDNVPWGFRLVGGSDFEIPLTVVKVTEGSLAEEAGLKLDDVIVRINDEPTSPMSHDEAHRVISSCGNVFFLGIQRAEEEEAEAPKFFPTIGNRETSRTPDPIIDPSIQNQIDELSKSPPPNLDVVENLLAEEPGIQNEDEEIASLLSPEPDVQDEQPVIGVNVNRVFPKPGVCKSSEVMRELNEEAMKTKQEKDLDKKKWTTFMQKPNRPIPKSKAQLEAEARAANAYKVKIVKNYKKPEPPRPSTPVPESEPEVIEPPKEKTPPPEVEEEPPTDTEVPNLEPTNEAGSQEEPSTEAKAESEGDKPAEETDTKGEEVEDAKDETTANEKRAFESVDREARSPSVSGSLREKTEEELQLEQQLANVQQQLLALANLPSTIQSTLDAVTKQLSELLPTFKLQPKLVKEATPEITVEVQQEERKEVTAEESAETSIIEKETVEIEEQSSEIISTEVTQSYHEETTVKIETESKQEVTVQEYETSHRNIEEEQMEEEQNLKRKKVWQYLQAVQQNLSSPRPKWPIPLIEFDENDERVMLPKELETITGA
ncbi:stage VI sporulation protein D isoform X2 [Episyrphus balteatus]|uniref:stage VI sporulation protein D isoform X2 n=1 Tax=Episyrphus balteatus TaxID=286459 RepID=UPI0024865ED5|nr:stage VI sporulation protein D isoform X2 [Episyrphus balteatus]